MKKFRLLSFLCLLMLFASSSYAVPLTQAMYNNSGSCGYLIGSTTGGGNGTTFYGDWDVNGNNYADLSAFSKLILNVSTSGAWRVIFNRVAPKGEFLEIYQGKNDDYYTWEWASDGTVNVFIDLVKIKREAGFARLNAIKNRSNDNLIIYSAKVEMAQQTWDFTTLSQDSRPSNNLGGYSAADGTGGTYWALNAMTNQSLGIGEAAGLTFTVTTNGRLGFREGGSLYVGPDTEIKIPYMAPGNVITISAERHGGSANAGTTYTITDGTITTTVGDLSSSPTSYVYKVQSGGTVVIKSTVGHIHLKSISVDKTHVQIGHRGSDSDWNSKYMDSPDWNMPVTLRDVNDNTITLQGYAADDFRITAVSDPDLSYDPASDVLNFVSKTISTGSQGDHYLNQKLHANHLGVATLYIEFLGNDGYYPSSDYADITVKEHIAVLEWQKNNVVVDEHTTQTTSGSLSNGPTLVKYIDNVQTTSGISVSYSSSNTNVATIDATTGAITIKGIGITVINARIEPASVKWPNTSSGVTYYYYNEAAASYTLIVQGTTTKEPRIIWVTAGKTDQNGNLNTYGYGNNARGSYLGQQYVQGKGIYYSAHYGNQVLVSAIALKSTVTNDQLATMGILPIPDSPFPNHFYVVDNTGDWRPSRVDKLPAEWRFDYVDQNDQGDGYFKYVKYMVDKPEMVRSRSLLPADAQVNNNNQRRYEVFANYPSQEPLRIYAYIDGYNTYSYTDVLIEPGELQMHFVPDENTVNAEKTILPYVNIPDLKLEDVNKIWVDINCPNTLSMENGGVVYETGKTTQADIAKYLYTVTANDTIWKNPDAADNHYADGKPNLNNIHQLKAVTWLRGVNPEIKGLTSGIGDNCTVTLHLTSEMYNEATATYKLYVVGDADVATMFHWEMNDKEEGEGPNKKHVDDGVMKTIRVVEGDYIYMPGIIGNANGNKEYSAEFTYKYVYSMNNGNIIMNRAKYFPGEGVPNYYLSYSSVKPGVPAVPETGTSTNQNALIFWSHGLGNYWRNDSLMIYGNKAGTMYLFAQDPQTHLTCTPIEVVVVPKQSLNDAKQTELTGMTYPFTWDFEHMDMSHYEADASVNGGTYWRSRWDEPARGKREGVQKYNRHYNVEKKYYQYNGGMNADWDDKDNNSTSRQRWFKDIYSYNDNGSIEYAPEFKGIMLNLSGLDYWEQKYQRFNIDKEGKYIFFEGGPIFVQLPGFGLLDKKTGVENAGTREYDNYIGGNDKTKGWHNHINTAKYNVDAGYKHLLSVDNKKNVEIQYPVQTKNANNEARDYRNNKVRFVIKAKGGRKLDEDKMGILIPNDNPNSQFHIGGASMINENLTVNDIRWSYDISDPTVHNGYSVLNLDNENAKVYIVELDPYDPELQDHIYLMFNNDVYVYWMAITNEPRNILSDFDGVTYSYPKDIDMEKTNLTLGMQTSEGIYTKASDAHDGTYALASSGLYTKKNVYQVTKGGEPTEVQLEAYTVSQFNPSKQAVTLSKINGNIPKNEGVMLYTTPRMSELVNTATGDFSGLTAATYNRGTTVYSVPYTEKVKNKDGEWVWVTKYTWHTATSGYNNVHDYYYLPLYFIAQAENMSEANYHAPESTYGGLEASEIPVISDNHVVTPNLLRPTTFGQVLSMDSRVEDQPISVINDNEVIHFGYNNEFICRNLYYVGEDQTKVMDVPYITRPDGTHEDLYYYEIGIEFARFYRINSPDLNHHNRSAYMTLTWDEYKVNTEGKPLSITTQGSNQAPKLVRFSSTSNPIDLVFEGANDESLVSEDGGFPDGISEVEQSTGDVKAYNLNGVRVNTLSKGVYIINGKKVVVK